MGPRVIGIFLEEEDFARKLAGYWARKAPQYEYRTYSECGAVLEDIREEPMYLFISDEAGYGCLAASRDDFTVNAVGRMVFLQEEPEDAAPDWADRQINAVWRYRPADELLAESLGMREGVAEAGAFRAHPMLEERSVLERPDLYGTAEDAASAAGDMKIFGVWSPVGRCGKTRFSLALAKEAAAQLEGRTLYLSLEVFSDMYRRTVTSGGLDISDLLYHLAEGTLDEKVWERAAANALPSGSAVSAAAVCAAANPEDVTGLGCEELRAVLDHAAGAGFAAAVVDIGSNHPRPDELLGLCDLVYAPVTDSECSKRKWEHFHAYMLAGGRAGLLDRIVTLVLPDAGTGYDSAGFPLPGEELELFVRRLPCWNA